MAENKKETDAKKRRYSTDIPVCSLEYKKIQKKVKSKRIEIESKTNEIQILKSQFGELQSATSASTVDDVDQENPRQQTSSFRSNIITPGGTKRKVNTARLQFKAHLTTVLQRVVKRKANSEVYTEDLIERLQEAIPSAKSERAKVLGLVSEIYGIKQKHRGKAKRGYYPGLAFADDMDEPTFRDETDMNNSPSNPPREKIPRENNRSACRGKLNFQDSFASMNDDVADLSLCDVEEELLLPMENLCREETSSQESSFKPSELYEAWCSAHNAVEKLNSDVRTIASEKEDLAKKINELEGKLENTESISKAIINKQDEVIELYKQILDSGHLLGGLLSLSERKAIQEEVKKTKTIFNIGFRNKNEDLIELFDPELFSNLVKQLSKECPTITNILEQLILSSNSSRNKHKTISMKMKAGVHLLGSLLDVRDQHSGNDIPVIFGLLCLCYGAGPSMIEVLQHLGMSESYSTLTGILRRQMSQYRELIKKRVPDNVPIITYQDNMQLMRTSLRHLRLSKLQKEKIKQGKMWDFTVRGWREADISDIEDLFAREETAAKCQREVNSLEYSDIKIECNKEHHERWEAFKERNALRQLDFGLNNVKMDKGELIAASGEELEKEASEAITNKKTYKVDIPDIYEDFPRQGKKETKIYPLPISHENQCTILGVAGNLDLFTEEFGFVSKNEKTYLPFNKSKKEFDLDKAYERYAFLKAYEKHKEQQKEYEQILRGQEIMCEETAPDGSEIEQLVTLPESDSDSEAET